MPGCGILIVGVEMEEVRNTLKLLAKNNQLGYPFSACLYNKRTGNALFAVNQVIAKKDPTAHAECMALRELYHFVMSEDWVIISSGEPCPMCLTAIAWSGIKEVYFIEDYRIAQDKGYSFDRDCFETNKVLNLGLTIQKL
jgi:tRNA(Arg) A34 adenosine deaminase TadA